MISLDTNMIISLLDTADTRHSDALKAITQYQAQGFVVSPVVYAELRAGQQWGIYQRWLQHVQMQVVWPMPPEVWDLAGERSAQYTAQRRSGQAPRRVLADFLIGAHAEFHGLDLLSFDQTVYGSVFPDVTLLQP